MFFYKQLFNERALQRPKILLARILEDLSYRSSGLPFDRLVNINEVVTRIKTFLGLQTIATAKFLSEYEDDRNFIGED